MSEQTTTAETTVIRDVTFDTTIPYGDEYAHVEVSSSALRANFTAEAIKQGLPPDIVEEYARQIQFHFGNPVDYLIQKYRNSPFLKDKASLALVLGHKITGRIPGWAGVERSVEGEPSKCIIGVEQIVESVEEGTFDARPSFSMPKSLPDEVRKTALVQVLDSIWRHERQHLIQDANPNLKAFDDHDKELKKLDIAFLVCGVSDAAMLGSFLALPHDIKFPVMGALFAVTIGSGAVVALKGDKLSYGTASEREAQIYSKSDHFTGNSPFKVTFEK